MDINTHIEKANWAISYNGIVILRSKNIKNLKRQSKKIKKNFYKITKNFLFIP